MPSPTDPPADLAAVAREIERLARRVEEMSPAVRRVGELDQAVEKLSNLITDIMERLRGEQAEAHSWMLLSGSLDPEPAFELLTDLVGWLDTVYLRFTGATLPACWMWHPDVVEELLWLRASHAKSYSGPGWEVRAGMWCDQQRPRVVERIRQYAGSCDLAQHEPAGQRAKPPLAAPLGGHARAIAEAWTAYGVLPEPTAEQLDDARKYRALKRQRTNPSSDTPPST